MAKLFLDGIFTDSSASPSSIRITVPNYNSKSDVPRLELVGLMTGDVSFSAQNSWGTIISDLSNLQDLSSLVGSDSQFSWINASTMCWKGTSPLSISIDFYLINYKRGLNLEKNLKTLVKMAALAKDSNASSWGGKYKVMVHGGYAPDLFEDNRQTFFTVGDVRSIYDRNLDAGTRTSKMYLNGDITASAEAAIQLEFGHKSKIKNLLLSKINVTESVIEVAGQDGKDIKPLYYRVSAQFTGVRPLITNDVDDMFNF